jgi:DNA mismatch endonuclease (patch repair protein)
MSRIRGKNTKIEISVFNRLEALKIPFSKHEKGLPGSPDIVFNEHKVAVFLDGDFWHGRGFSGWSNKLNEFWRNKIINNIRRDRRNDRHLRKMGWSVIHIWGSDVKKSPDKAITRIIRLLNRRSNKFTDKNAFDNY